MTWVADKSPPLHLAQHTIVRNGLADHGGSDLAGRAIVGRWQG